MQLGDREEEWQKMARTDVGGDREEEWQKKAGTDAGGG
jgi:hypothetical protein